MAAVVLVLGGATVALIVLPIGRAPPPSFYSSAAQIIPLLVIALAVEGRARDVWDPYPGLVRVSVIGTLCLGELVGILGASGVLSNFSTKDQENYGLVGPGWGSSEVMAAVTALALIVGFLAVVWVALVKHDGRGRSNADGQAKREGEAEGIPANPAGCPGEPIHVILEIRLGGSSSAE